MQINSLTPTSLASTVWTNATRTLTAFPLAALNSEVAANALVTSSALASTFGAYTQLNAALAHNVVGVILTGISNAGAGTHIGLALATGAALSEVNKIIAEIDYIAGLSGFYIPLDPSIFVKGSRLSMASRNDSAAAAINFTFDITIIEDAA